MNKYIADNLWLLSFLLVMLLACILKTLLYQCRNGILGDCFKCWRLPPLTYFLLYQRHSWLDRKARWLAPSHPVCFCTSLLCAAGSCSYSFFVTLPHYTLSNCSLFLWPWSPTGWSKRSGTVFFSYLLERLETWGYFSAKKSACICTLVGFFTILSCNIWLSALGWFCSPLAPSWILALNNSCLQTSYIWYTFIKRKWIINQYCGNICLYFTGFQPHCFAAYFYFDFVCFCPCKNAIMVA